MASSANILNYKKDIKVVLLYPPHQSWPGTSCKPNGSLAYPCIGGALIEKGIEVKVFDACTGNEKDQLEDVFFKSTELPTGLLRTGVRDERILEEISSADVIGLTSIFSDQETMVLNTVRNIKKVYPEKLIIAGGVNARYRKDIFLSNSVDIVCLSEAERTIQRIVEILQKGGKDFSSISSIAFKDNGKVVTNRTKPGDIIWDLDDLPMPAWHLLPNERYWKIARPHGGCFVPGEKVRYASMMTSLGCVFSCSFCHIAGENEQGISGEIGKFRIKSDDRVLREIEELKYLGVNKIFIEDDSLFGRKKRGMRLIKKIINSEVDIYNVNPMFTS